VATVGVIDDNIYGLFLSLIASRQGPTLFPGIGLKRLRGERITNLIVIVSAVAYEERNAT
jgi:hypothetical protein